MVLSVASYPQEGGRIKKKKTATQLISGVDKSIRHSNMVLGLEEKKSKQSINKNPAFRLDMEKFYQTVCK